ncbi:MAG: MgtC/SapB family protein [Acutalibacteraceae bacterium]|nr:MgtC/SapB family protein [Acutalibacteraceae bacterium]
MIPVNYIEIIIQLVLAVILGGIIGVERSGTNHDAGLRTHILVCLGSAGVMIMSRTLVGDFGGDVMRIGAQVVSGIGFLGAGCILVHGKKIRGLTTAAGLWATACLGLIIGSGYYFIAIVMAALIVGVMLVLRPVTKFLQKKGREKICRIRIYPEKPEDFGNAYKYITEGAFHVTSMIREADGSVIVCVADTDENTADLIISSLLTDTSIRKIEKI